MATQSGSSILASSNNSTLPPIYDEQVWDACYSTYIIYNGVFKYICNISIP